MEGGGGADHLADERRKARFDVDEMKIVWAGSRHAFEVSDRVARLVASDPVITLSSPYPPSLRVRACVMASV